MLKLTERMKEMMNVQWGSLDSMATVHVYAIVHLFLRDEKWLIWEHLYCYFVNLGEQIQCLPIRFTWEALEDDFVTSKTVCAMFLNTCNSIDILVYSSTESACKYWYANDDRHKSRWENLTPKFMYFDREL